MLALVRSTAHLIRVRFRVGIRVRVRVRVKTLCQGKATRRTVMSAPR